MATLLQSIQEMINNISVTDRQEDSIEISTNNLNNNLVNHEDLHVDSTFVNGSYERDTILRPLDDIDIFAVLNKDEWQDAYYNLPSPEDVLKKIKKFLNSLPVYEGKVTQDRPCVTVKLNDKNFDVLPSFENTFGGYMIPNFDLSHWDISYPKQLTENLNKVNRNINYKLKPTIKAIKYWNRENDKLIPSYHIEETLISIFNSKDFENFEQAIRLWFNEAESYFDETKFKTSNKYKDAKKKVEKVKNKLNEAKEHLDNKQEGKAKKIWKDVFTKEFPAVDISEAKNYSDLLTKGTLKVGSTGIISANSGRNIPASKGFYGDI